MPQLSRIGLSSGADLVNQQRGSGSIGPELDVQKEVFILLPVEMNLTFEPGKAK